ANRKIAVLGDMLELGEYSNELHKKVGEEVAKNKIDILVTVGEMGKVISNTAKEAGIVVYQCENNQNAIDTINSIVKPEDVVLVKASNGMKFKEIVEGLMKN
ncbi:MAG: UDP-N-acetylmuramoyl-tripeptide--D-alanyl-D-alanine ligase, partial [Clostridia bacterium]|nr:UDP-N-acetylmuramoyl-tripeptide--D-alanyl-D-alanine ligase [Clostridia bacterium]